MSKTVTVVMFKPADGGEPKVEGVWTNRMVAVMHVDEVNKGPGAGKYRLEDFIVRGIGDDEEAIQSEDSEDG